MTPFQRSAVRVHRARSGGRDRAAHAFGSWVATAVHAARSRLSIAPTHSRPSRDATARHAGFRPSCGRPAICHGQASGRPATSATTTSHRSRRAEASIAAQRRSSRAFAASMMRQASRKKVSYPIASMASAKSGSRRARDLTHTSTLVKPSISDLRSPAGATGSLGDSSSPASGPWISAVIPGRAAGGLSAGKGGSAGASSLQAAPTRTARPLTRRVES